MGNGREGSVGRAARALAQDLAGDRPVRRVQTLAEDPLDHLPGRRLAELEGPAGGPLRDHVLDRSRAELKSPAGGPLRVERPAEVFDLVRAVLHAQSTAEGLRLDQLPSRTGVPRARSPAMVCRQGQVPVEGFLLDRRLDLPTALLV